MSKTGNKDTLPIAAMVVFYVLASAAFAVLPLLVGATVELLGFTAKQAGLIGGADMFGATISALCVSFIIPRGKWRLLIIWGVLILTVADAFSGLAQLFPALLLGRFVAGLGEGMVLTIATVSIAETRNPDRVYGFAAAGLVAYGSPALYLMPALLGRLRFAWGVLVPGCPDRRHNTSGAVHARLRALERESNNTDSKGQPLANVLHRTCGRIHLFHSNGRGLGLSGSNSHGTPYQHIECRRGLSLERDRRVPRCLARILA